MSGVFQIRTASAFDPPLLEALHRASCNADWDEAWSAQSFAAALAMPGAVGLIAASDDAAFGFSPLGFAPIGFVLGRIAADEAEVLLIATHPAKRRQGVARSLLADLLQRFGDIGAKRIFLEVAAPNAAALALYEAAGFRPVGRRPNYYRPQSLPSGTVAIDAVLLVRDLHDIL